MFCPWVKKNKYEIAERENKVQRHKVPSRVVGWYGKQVIPQKTPEAESPCVYGYSSYSASGESTQEILKFTRNIHNFKS